MLERAPDGYLAIRTGQASRLLVIDAEASTAPQTDVTGLDVLDQWESWTAGQAGSLATTRAARSVSGGLHLYYQLPAQRPAQFPAQTRISSRNRILPCVDIKADGGLVGAVGSRNERRFWVDEDVPVASVPAELLTWLDGDAQRSRFGSRGRGVRFKAEDGFEGVRERVGNFASGYDFKRFEREGCPDGHRDSFFNDLLFRYRKSGVSLEEATVQAYEHWLRVAQPPLARNRCEWHHIQYKISRVWNEVHPSDDLIRASHLARQWRGDRFHSESESQACSSDNSIYSDNSTRLGSLGTVQRPLSRNALIEPY